MMPYWDEMSAMAAVDQFSSHLNPAKEVPALCIQIELSPMLREGTGR